MSIKTWGAQVPEDAFDVIEAVEMTLSTARVQGHTVVGKVHIRKVHDVYGDRRAYWRISVPVEVAD